MIAPVPPEALTLMVPLAPPLQETGVELLVLIVGANWLPTANGTMVVQPLASVIVMLYDAAPRLLNVPDGDAAPPFKEYVYGPIPPEAVTDKLPLLAEHVALMLEAEVVIVVGDCTVIDELTVHPFASVAVMLYVPAAKFEKVPLACNGEPLIEYLTGEVPPEVVRVTVPLLPPLQLTGVEEDAVTTGPGWLETTTGIVTVHPLESVTVAL